MCSLFGLLSWGAFGLPWQLSGRTNGSNFRTRPKQKMHIPRVHAILWSNIPTLTRKVGIRSNANRRHGASRTAALVGALVNARNPTTTITVRFAVAEKLALLTLLVYLWAQLSLQVTVSGTAFVLSFSLFVLYYFDTLPITPATAGAFKQLMCRLFSLLDWAAFGLPWQLSGRTNGSNFRTICTRPKQKTRLPGVHAILWSNIPTFTRKVGIRSNAHVGALVNARNPTTTPATELFVKVVGGALGVCLSAQLSPQVIAYGAAAVLYLSLHLHVFDCFGASAITPATAVPLKKLQRSIRRLEKRLDSIDARLTVVEGILRERLFTADFSRV
jgi:hypothetical protein